MGKLFVSVGGGGADTDVVTADAGDVIKDKIIVNKDGDPIIGTLQLVGTAKPEYVLAGHTFYNTDAQAIQVGTMAIQSAISFSAAAQSTTTIRISWTNPSIGPWSGVKIRMSTSGSPGVSGGTLKYTGTGSSAVAGATSYVDITGLEVGTTYYFTCYSYVTGLGDSTTGYNVSAKTKGLLLFANGSSPYSWTNATISSGHFVIGSAYRQGQWGNSPRSAYMSTTVNLSGYTKLRIQLIESSDSVTTNSWIGSIMLWTKSDTKTWGQTSASWYRSAGASFDLTLPLSSLGGTYNITAFQVTIGYTCWDKSWESAHDFNANPHITKMWFE